MPKRASSTTLGCWHGRMNRSVVRRGEVWLVDLPPPKDHEQALPRPAVILQVDDLADLWTVVIIPMTRALQRAREAGTVLIPQGEAGQHHASIALCYQIRAVDRRRPLHKIGDLPAERLSEIEAQVAWICGIP